MLGAGRRPLRALELGGAVFSSWEAFYQSDVQGLYGLVLVPTLFLLWMLLVRPPATGGTARFVRAWAIVFAIATILDPLVTGPGVRWLGVDGEPALVLFVLLGDFRVFLLVCFLLAPERGLGPALCEAAAWTLVVPALAWTVTAGLRTTFGSLPSVTIWIVYETAFALLALGFRTVIVPRQPSPHAAYLRVILAYVAVYYALWAAADLLVLGGVDAGWALRVLPNQLYYALWVPAAYALFVCPRYASTSSAVQAAR
jgi:hypothetical protein